MTDLDSGEGNITSVPSVTVPQVLRISPAIPAAEADAQG